MCTVRLGSIDCFDAPHIISIKMLQQQWLWVITITEQSISETIISLFLWKKTASNRRGTVLKKSKILCTNTRLARSYVHSYLRPSSGSPSLNFWDNQWEFPKMALVFWFLEHCKRGGVNLLCDCAPGKNVIKNFYTSRQIGMTSIVPCCLEESWKVVAIFCRSKIHLALPASC